MITEDYVSLEVAKLLKEKGFDEPCRLYYDKYHGYVPVFVEDSKLTEYGYKELVRNDQNNISDFIASAPSLYVAMKWLREVHNLNVEVDRTTCGYIGYIVDIPSGIDIKSLEDDGDDLSSGQYTKWEYACEAAIKYCLENLAEINTQRMTKTKLTKASDCNCYVCGKPAVAFWPIIDPDIPSKPYCRECLDKEKKELLIKLFEDEHTSRNDKGRD